MKKWLKIFVAIVILTVCVVCFSSGRAEAAYTTDGTYYCDPWIDLDWGDFVSYKDIVKSRNNGYVIIRVSDTSYSYIFNDALSLSYLDGYWNGYPFYAIYARDVLYVNPHEGVVTGADFDLKKSIGLYLMTDSGDFTSVIASTFDYRNNLSVLNNMPYCNVFYDSIFVPTSTVSLSVDGKDVTITEPYEYYFVSYAYDKVRLIFSDEPLTADYVSLDKVELYSGEQTTVCYTWDEDNPDFLASRMVFDYDWTITHSLSSDYSSNYDVLNSRTGYTVLNTKLLHPVVEDLFSTLPDELLAYDYYIVLRQDSPFAYTHDVVFYGWNDVNADLIIRWGDSSIRAAKNGKVVSDQVLARYKPDTNTWEIDTNTPISICSNDTYNVPYIYYSSSDLFMQASNQSGWYTNGLCVYMADLEAPNLGFDEPEIDDGEITGIEWIDNLLKGLGSLLSRLFVPSASYIQRKIDVLTSRFTFWKSVADTVYVFFNFLRDTDFTKPPKVVLDLSAANSKINYGLSAFSLDMTWYEPYKPEVDVLLSAIMWLTFIWNTFKALPATISGVGGSFASTMVSADKKGGE